MCEDREFPAANPNARGGLGINGLDTEFYLLEHYQHPERSPLGFIYSSFTDAALDVVEARILQGIHTRTADLNGRQLGKKVARWVFKHALTPLDKQHHSNGYHDDDQNDQD